MASTRKMRFRSRAAEGPGPDPDLVVERSEQDFLDLEARIAEIIADAGLSMDTVYEPALRHRPTTEKGRKTVTNLLDSALDVVGREGIRAANTRSIAREAGVNIATLYQYFDDIDALLRAAALRDQALRTAILGQRAIDLAVDAPLRDWVETTVELVVEGALATDHHLAVMTALRAVPALRSIPRLGWETGALMLATALAYRYGEDPVEYWLPYTRAVQSATRLVADDVMEDSPEDMERVWQVTEMAWEYLLARIPETPANSRV
ncbi:MAG: TetR/AcrR family transcriptional regulator [Solirubrobacterales bacterium]